MGQLRSKTCPICEGSNSGRWACDECKPLLDTMREAIRNLQSWRSQFEALEVSDTLVAQDGREFTLWDITYFYEQRHLLPDQMRVAVELCLYENVLERDAAVRMGTSETNPVSVYATVGLTKMLRMARDGLLPMFRIDTFQEAQSA